MSEIIQKLGTHKVRISKDGVAAFNRRWPCSELSSSRAYWFEFDSDGDGDLVDTDVPEQDDGSAASAMAQDAKEYLFNDTIPEWL